MNGIILPADQRRAAELTEACINADAGRVGDLLAELLDAGAERTIATVAVLARNLGSTLVESVGKDDALRICEMTRLDAAVAE